MGDNIETKVKQEWFDENVSDGSTLQPLPLATIYMKTEFSEDVGLEQNQLDDGVMSNNLVKDEDPLQPASLPAVCGDSTLQTKIKQEYVKIEPIDITDVYVTCAEASGALTSTDPALGVSSSGPTHLQLNEDSREKQIVPSDIRSKPRKRNTKRPNSSDSLSAMVVDRKCKRVGSVADEVTATLLPSNTKKIFKCHLCAIELTSGYNLKRHLLAHSVAEPHKSEEGGAALPVAQLLKRRQDVGSSRRPHECNVCQASFVRRDYLVVHLMSHTRKRPFTCDTCQASFVWRNSLVVHLKKHTRERPFKCDKCPATFAGRDYLLVHHKTHAGELPFRCATCGDTFARRGLLALHGQVHTSDRPYRCGTCDYSFVYHSGLANHMRMHSGEQAFKCDTCGKSFTGRGQLNMHVHVHKEEEAFKCVTCGKRFTTRRQTKMHARLHTGERPYKCDTCGNRFVYHTTLFRHMSKHTGVRYQCGKCDKSYPSTNNLARHMKKHQEATTDVVSSIV